MSGPRPRPSRRWLIVTVVALLGLSSCVAIWTPPAPEGTHPFAVGETDGEPQIVELPLLVPTNPILAALSSSPAHAHVPYSAQFAPDGSSILVAFGVPTCDPVVLSATAIRLTDALEVTVRVGSAGLSFLLCKGDAAVAGTRIRLGEPVDPEHPPAVVDSFGDPVDVTEYLGDWPVGAP